MKKLIICIGMLALSAGNAFGWGFGPGGGGGGGTASTATALAADPAGCAGGQATTDINASGVSSCTSWSANVLTLLGAPDYATFLSSLGAEATQTAASQVEAEAGTEAAIRSFSPLRVGQAIAALGNVGDITSIGTDTSGAVPFLQFAWTNFGAGDTTPDVSAAMQYKTVDTTTITGFDHGGGAITDGRHLIVECGAATVFDLTSSEITASNRTTDYTCTAGVILEFVYDTDQWYALNIPDAITTVADPDADRGYFWDDSETAPGLWTPVAPLEFSTTNFQISTAGLAKINRYHQTAHVNPDVVYANNAGIIVLDPKTAAALTITEIAVYLDEDPTTELTITCFHKTAAIAYTGGTQIDANDTVAGTFVANSAFDDATVPAGSKMWCVIGDDPDATNTDLEISITGTYD